MSERIQIEMDDPEPQGREESMDQFLDRLNVWVQEQKKKYPNRKDGQDTEEYYERRIEFFEAIGSRARVATIAAKDAEYAAIKAEHAAKDATIATQNAKIAAMDATIAAMDATIATEDAICSVKSLLETHGELPTLQISKCAKLSHNPLHLDAEIKPLQDKISLDDFEVNYFKRTNDGRRMVKSMLGVLDQNNGGVQLKNFNEATASFLVVLVLYDVLACLGIKAEVAQEMSFFAMRPDIVVLYYMEAIVMVIDVKNQGCDGNLAMSSENAAGQCLDHTFALRGIGIDTPIVCLSTYSMMRIGSPKQSIQPILEKTLERLKKMSSNNLFDIGVGENKKPGVSLDKKKIKNCFEIPCDKLSPNRKARKHTKPPDEDEEGGDGRVIYFSDTFDTSNIFKALYLATACGCISAELSRKANGDVSKLKRNPIPNEGEVLKERWYNVVQSDSYKWVKVTDIEVTYSLKTSWDANMKVYMGDVLGMGSSGKVYMSMDSAGRHFALKMLFYDSADTEAFDPTEREELLKQKVSEEAERWRFIYPVYSKSIWEGTLNGQPCLAMPYVASIPEGRRGQLLNKIKREINRIADLGFFYNEEDTRWNHIGLRKDIDQNEIIVFLDMESLEYSESLVEAEQRNKVEEFMKKKEVAVNKFISDLFCQSGGIPEERCDGLKDNIIDEANRCADKGSLYETSGTTSDYEQKKTKRRKLP